MASPVEERARALYSCGRQETEADTQTPATAMAIPTVYSHSVYPAPPREGTYSILHNKLNLILDSDSFILGFLKFLKSCHVLCTTERA